MKLKRIIEKGIADSFIIWREELRNVKKDIGVVIFFMVVPLIYPVLYGLIYNPETIREVPLVVVDESHSSLSRQFIRKIDATPDVLVYTYVSSMEEAKRVVDRKEAYGILLIPSDFSQKINRGEQSRVALYIDMSGLLFYKAILLATTEASLDMGATIHLDSDIPVPYESVAFYNTQNGFASFLLPAILILVIQQTLLLGISMLGATSREKNNGRLIPPNPIYEGTLRIVVGKAFAYLTIYIFICIWALEIVPSLFNLPQIAHHTTILLFALPYLLSCIFFSMIIATFIRGRETPMMVLVFTSLPILFLSGISWPLTAIPDFWRYVSYLFPSTFGIQGFVKLNTMGAALEETAFEYQMLWVQTGIYFITTCLIYRHKLRCHDRP